LNIGDKRLSDFGEHSTSIDLLPGLPPGAGRWPGFSISTFSCGRPGTHAGLIDAGERLKGDLAGGA
jgi:hypothetical protein